MGKINITKITGEVESLNLISAFKTDGIVKVVFDSEKVGSMGLPIIYISKYTTKLEKITDDNEWQNVKNNLKGIINGTNFEYVAIPENVSSDDVYYTPLTLPAASFDAIKNNYVVASPIIPDNNVVSNMEESIIPPVNVSPNIPPAAQPVNDIPPVEPIVSPVAPASFPESPLEVTPQVTPEIEPQIAPHETLNVPPHQQPLTPPTPIDNSSTINFDTDKETFLKACENMFDALVSKYQKELLDLEKRENNLLVKEQEINEKMKAANEALANANAKEQVANIAHANAQKVMDFSSIIPHPNNEETPV